MKLLLETLLVDIFTGEAPGAKVHKVTRVNLYLEVYRGSPSSSVSNVDSSVCGPAPLIVDAPTVNE